MLINVAVLVRIDVSLPIGLSGCASNHRMKLCYYNNFFSGKIVLLDGFSENFFGDAIGIHVCSIECLDACIVPVGGGGDERL